MKREANEWEERKREEKERGHVGGASGLILCGLPPPMKTRHSSQ